MSLCWSARLYLSVLLWATKRSAVSFCLIFQKCYVNFTSVLFFYYTIAPVHNSQYLRIFGIWRGLSLHFSNWGQRFACYSSDLCQEPVVSVNWRIFRHVGEKRNRQISTNSYNFVLIWVICPWSKASSMLSTEALFRQTTLWTSTVFACVRISPRSPLTTLWYQAQPDVLA